MWKEASEAIAKVFSLARDVEQCKTDIEELRTCRRELRELRREQREGQREMQRLTSLVEHFIYKSENEREKLTLQLENTLLKMERRLPPASENRPIE